MKRILSAVLRILLRLLSAWIYVSVLFRYLCASLHLAWEPDWWKLVFGHDGHHFYLIQFLRSPEHLANAFYHLENLVIDRMAYAMDQKLLHYITTLPVEETLPFLIISIMLLLAFFYLLAYGNRILGQFWVLLHIGIVSVPFLFREIPAISEFFILAALVLAMGGSAAGRERRKTAAGKKEDGIAYRRQAAELRHTGILVLLAATGFLASVLLTPEKYLTRQNVIEEKKTALTDWGERFFASLEGEQGRFPTEGKRIGNSDPVMEVTLKKPAEGIIAYQTDQKIYLKEYAGVHYGRRGWEPYRQEEKDRLELLREQYGWKPEEWQLNPAVTIEENADKEGSWLTYSMMAYGTEHPATLQTEPVRNARGRVFSLYGATDFGTDTRLSPVYDLYVTGRGRRISQEFTWYPERFYLYGSWSIQESRYRPALDTAFTGMEDYQQFVYDTYLELPEGLGEGFHKVLEEIEELMPAMRYRYPDMTEKCRHAMLLMIWLQNYCSYDLEPGKVPEGQNMVEYFLAENRKGYCVHFASAATLLLRAMGIPARYAEGYLVRESDLTYTRFEYVERENEAEYETVPYDVLTGMVTGDSAHAWVEVWADEFGFLPLEYTPGSDPDGMGEAAESSGADPDTAEDKTGDEALAAEDEEEAEEDEEEKPLPEKEKLPEIKPEAPAVQKDSQQQQKTIWRRISPIFCGTGLITAGFAAWIVWQRLHYRRMDNRRKVLYWYRRWKRRQRLSRRKVKHSEYPGLPDPECMERVEHLARKARFSDREITEKEVEFIRNFTRNFLKKEVDKKGISR